MYVVITPNGFVSRTPDESIIASTVPVLDQSLDQISGDAGYSYVYNKALCGSQTGGRNTVATAVAGAILGEAYEGVDFYGPIVVVGACNTLPHGSYAQLTVDDADTILQYFFDTRE